VNLVGAPSSEKTTVLSFFYELEDIVIKSDNFTPRCFVSHASNTDKDLEEVDLLPRIKDKTLIVPELATVFGKRKEDLTESLGIITRIFDGEGFESDSGIHGRRGYVGDYKFTWLGATTPLKKSIWKVMGNMGTRWLFFRMDDGEKNEDEKLQLLLSNDSYGLMIKECREITHRLLKSIFIDGYKRNLRWDNTKNEKVTAEVIVSCAEILKRIRAPLVIWKESDEKDFEYETPLIEKPYRIINILGNLAKGHAISEGRGYLIEDDLPVVVNVTLSSMPENRRKLFHILVKNLNIDVWNAELVKEKVNCGEKKALQVLATLQKLGLLEEIPSVSTSSQGGRPPLQYRWVKEIKVILEQILPYYTLGGFFREVHGAQETPIPNRVGKAIKVRKGKDEVKKNPSNTVGKNGKKPPLSRIEIIKGSKEEIIIDLNMAPVSLNKGEIMDIPKPIARNLVDTGYATYIYQEIS
jgi:hypothetical protein